MGDERAHPVSCPVCGGSGLVRVPADEPGRALPECGRCDGYGCLIQEVGKAIARRLFAWRTR